MNVWTYQPSLHDFRPHVPPPIYNVAWSDYAPISKINFQLIIYNLWTFPLPFYGIPNIQSIWFILQKFGEKFLKKVATGECQDASGYRTKQRVLQGLLINSVVCLVFLGHKYFFNVATIYCCTNISLILDHFIPPLNNSIIHVVPFRDLPL